MNKYERLNKIMDDYFANVSSEQLVRDSAEAGIKLVKSKAKLERDSRWHGRIISKHNRKGAFVSNHHAILKTIKVDKVPGNVLVKIK